MPDRSTGARPPRAGSKGDASTTPGPPQPETRQDWQEQLRPRLAELRLGEVAHECTLLLGLAIALILSEIALAMKRAVIGVPS